MKIILSRKGFDSGSGGMPNLILPDNTLLAMPIPETGAHSDCITATYKDLVHNGKTYYDILQEVRPNKIAEDCKCHADPDICYRYREDVVSRDKWNPAFGQHGISQLHLCNYDVKVGDIFLFFGWFRRTKEVNGKLQFMDRREDATVDKHVIFGYMQVGKIIKDQSIIKESFPHHPHAQCMYDEHNVIYVPSDTLSLDTTKKGYGMLKFSDKTQLTKEGYKRGEWDLPKCLHDAEITFHKNGTYGWKNNKEYFQVANRGQEFIVEKEMDDDMRKWLLEVVTE